MPRHYGLIGRDLSHSFSPDYFASKFQNLQLDNSYRAFSLSNVDEIDDLLENNDLSGFNVTIPFKESILAHLDEIDIAAKQIGAVNTVDIRNQRLIGYNTDYIGFQKAVRPFLAKEHSRALVLGSGGASKAICYALEQMQIPYFIASRQEDKANNTILYQELNKDNLSHFPFIINCTPIGTFPNSEVHPPIPLAGIQNQHFVFDLIYNPKETLLLKTAKKAGALYSNGLNMLKIQADEAWKIWNRH